MKTGNSIKNSNLGKMHGFQGFLRQVARIHSPTLSIIIFDNLFMKFAYFKFFDACPLHLIFICIFYVSIPY